MPTAQTLLKSHKLRNTEFRVKVLEIFLNSSHAAVSNQALEGQLGEHDRITLYRTLKSFEKNGLIHQVVDESNITKYALCHNDCKVHSTGHDHAHFHCKQCGQTYCMDNQVNELKLELPKRYILDKVQLSLSGTCEQCN